MLTNVGPAAGITAVVRLPIPSRWPDAAVVLRDTLPKTMVGKLDRKALRLELAAAGRG